MLSAQSVDAIPALLYSGSGRISPHRRQNGGLIIPDKGSAARQTDGAPTRPSSLNPSGSRGHTTRGSLHKRRAALRPRCSRQHPLLETEPVAVLEVPPRGDHVAFERALRRIARLRDMFGEGCAPEVLPQEIPRLRQ
jgi:hypothetical protein